MTLKDIISRIIKSVISKREYIFAALILLFLNIIFFYQVYLFGEVRSSADFLFLWEPWNSIAPENFQVGNYVNSDIVESGYPIHNYLFNQIKEGQFPLWNNIHGLGAPNGVHIMVTQLIHPNYAIPLFFTNNYLFAINFSELVKIFLGGFFTYVLLRKYNISKTASLLGGIIGSFALYNIVWLYSTLSYTSAFIPLVLWSIERLFQKISKRNFLIFILSSSLLAIGGFFSTVGYAIYMFGLYTILKSIHRFFRGEPIKKIILRLVVFISAGLVSIGLLAITLFPTYEYLSNQVDLSYREGSHSGKLLSE